MVKSRVVTAIFLMAFVLLPVHLSVAAGEEDDIVTMVENAATPAQHLAVAAKYRAKADVEKQEIETHRKMARTYRESKQIMFGVMMEEHCNKIIARREKVAAEYEALAIEHEAVAKHPPGMKMGGEKMEGMDMGGGSMKGMEMPKNQ